MMLIWLRHGFKSIELLKVEGLLDHLGIFVRTIAPWSAHKVQKETKELKE
jgi:hypothetical protein